MRTKVLVIVLLLSSCYLHAQTIINVLTWNIESGEASPSVIAAQLGDFQDIDLFGLSEVSASAVTILEQGIEANTTANYETILSASGGGDRMSIVYNADEFELLNSTELDHINIGGNVRAPLVGQFREISSGFEFYFMVNHLYRSKSARRRLQSSLLNEWAASAALPVIATGDYNYDWEVIGGDTDHDEGYDLLIENDVFTWVRPTVLHRTQCSATNNGGCRYNSVLDFIFEANMPLDANASSEILTWDGQFPDDNTTSDHRPILGTFQIPVEGVIPDCEQMQLALERLVAIEAELARIRLLLQQSTANN